MNASDESSAIFFNVISGPGETSRAWADVVMSLTRQLGELSGDRYEESPFALGVTFHAPSIYTQPDWSGVRLGRLSTRYAVLNAEAALPDFITEDPVSTVIGLAAEAVEQAARVARKRRLAENLDEMTRLLERLAEAGPAPVSEPSYAKPSRLSDDGRAGEAYAGVLHVRGSSGERYDDPSEGLLESMLDDVLDGVEDDVELERIDGAGLATLRLTRDAGRIRLRRSEPGATEPLVAEISDPDLALEAVLGWAFEGGELPTDVAWRPERH